jgi:hypothetical protein
MWGETPARLLEEVEAKIEWVIYAAKNGNASEAIEGISLMESWLYRARKKLQEGDGNG